LNDPNTPVKTLVVLDNLESIADQSDRQWFEQFLRQWAADGKGSRVLVTTRSQVLSQEPIALVGFDRVEGATFLEREGLTGDRFSDLITLAKGHPLLLKLVASWTKETYDSRVDDRAIDFFTKLFANYNGDPKAGVSVIFDVVFDALPIGLQELLCRLSVYRLPFDKAMAIAMVAEATIGELEALAGQGLLLAQGDRFVLHPLVAGLVRSRVTEEVLRDGHERAIGFYEANYQEWDGTIESCRSELEGFYHACELGEYTKAEEILDRCYGPLNLAGEWLLLLPLYEKLTTKWNENNIEAKNLALNWNRAGNLHQNLGNYSSAIKAYQQTRIISQQLDLEIGKSAAFAGLGNAYASLGDYQKAIELHFKSLSISQSINDISGIANAFGSLGNNYQSICDYDKAIEFHSLCLQFMEMIENHGGVIASLGNLGNAYRALGNYKKAFEFHSQQSELSQKMGYKNDFANAVGSLGNDYQAMGKNNEALKLYKQMRELMEVSGNKMGLAISLGNMGGVYQLLGDYYKAIDFCCQHIALSQLISDKAGEARSIWNLSIIYHQRGRIKLARLYKYTAYKIWQDMHMPLAAIPVPQLTKNKIEYLGERWADELISSETAMEWLILPLDYLLFTLRILLSPLTQLQTRLKIQPKIFWFCVGIAIVLVTAWFKK
jgi:tetratricopeptide (TPR) repeat protein